MLKNNLKTHVLILICIALGGLSSYANTNEPTLRIATFNVSIEATNYLSRDDIIDDPSRSAIVTELLSRSDYPQLRNIAEIIQRVRPDIVLLNEFDYVPEPQQGIEQFIRNYLSVSQNAQPAITYPYHYIAPVNTGLASPYDFDNNGQKTGVAGDAYGFGLYPGHYAMALLSRYPIKLDQVRTLQKFLWKDMPGALQPLNTDGSPWYSAEEWRHFRLSSKSHWDIPVETESGVIHVIAAHPTPPTFDGAEDRNGKRNHDEIRLISDYLSNVPYLYSDDGSKGGLPNGVRFVVLGDLNSSPDEGDSLNGAIQKLLAHPLVDSGCTPTSDAGQQLRPDNPFSARHTTAWGLQVDYVLPSRAGLSVQRCGLFWPTENDPLNALVAERKASSDHRLVWVDVFLK